MTRFRTQLNRSVTHLHPRKSLKYQHIFEYRPVSFYAVNYCTDALCIKDGVKIDPCMGSGHILVYAFDVLMQIYKSQGYTQRDAAQSILQNNLYGLDIDERAAQLAYFAVMMKARQYDRRIFSRGIQPHVYAIVESNGLSGLWTKDNKEMRELFDTMRDAKEYGSILTIPVLNFDVLRQYARNKVTQIEQFDLESNDLPEQLPQVLTLINVAEMLAKQYQAVVTNPPYMGSSGMGAKLSNFIKQKYPDSKSDLFAVFIERCGTMTAHNGCQAMITQHAWMFLASFDKLRRRLLQKNIINMVHLGARAFEEIGGEIVQTASFVLRISYNIGYKGTYCRLIEPTTQQGKEKMFLVGENRYVSSQSNFATIPGSPVAYWVSDQFLKCYDNELISSVAFSDGQILTGNNEKYLRLIWEVAAKDIIDKKWVLHAKGGEFRRWYGNIDTVVKFDPVSINHYRSDHIARFPKDEVLFRRGITWTLVSMNPNFGVRELSDELTFNKAAATILFRNDEKINYVLGFLNTKVAQALLKVINPTMNNNIKDILAMPYIESETQENKVRNLVDECIAISKDDWDSFEESWDFKKHPLI
ncbi:MAG: BREX-1 system adenine-specific DNA-methyltransferase PglX [Bacteroides thetaiotaomicron]|nr:BREX-1 system adenine-specific DNA-methyltransferase PglX [Bacteroides thetaiotaomicron]